MHQSSCKKCLAANGKSHVQSKAKDDKLTSRRSRRFREWQYAFLRGSNEFLSKVWKQTRISQDSTDFSVLSWMKSKAPVGTRTNNLWLYIEHCSLNLLEVQTFKCWSIRAYVRHLNRRSAWSGRLSCPLCSAQSSFVALTNIGWVLNHKFQIKYHAYRKSFT
jgi:hypothetical protein